jgi:hypothetical protein
VTNLKTFAYVATGYICVVLFAKTLVFAWMAVVLISSPFWLIYSLPRLKQQAIARWRRAIRQFIAYTDDLSEQKRRNAPFNVHRY